MKFSGNKLNIHSSLQKPLSKYLIVSNPQSPNKASSQYNQSTLESKKYFSGKKNLPKEKAFTIGNTQMEVASLLLDFKQEINRFFMVDQLLLLKLKTEFYNLQETFDSQWLEVCRKVRKYRNQSPQLRRRRNK
jgi:hypothetical protein